ncbi:M20/M25/M40 family metallo-hydrolase [Muricauda sp. 2012CJ35-5]|uniref:M20/M25/M40 family metallo-hydrolase n=1 Tax=Flagellimonas spongiicola TaxID=2942208 RepID=A0ABT0PLZ4_9FLAO|nr:M20/M25/M40 family metallo-hydrolase [Allomuricauda spongiicola]MCL6272387.1 M20/M25/M40 family metallo-hydrolase [Allomuricauda spongiicola]
MKNILTVASVLLVVSCGTTQKLDTYSNNDQPNGPDGLKAKTTQEINSKTINTNTFSKADRVGEIMTYLASDDLKGRDSGSDGIDMAATYIENYLTSYQVKPYFESFRDTLSNFEKTAYNVVGIVEGNDPKLKNEYIIIGAHYDHIGLIEPENGDIIANGANDNASGTTTVMELARYFGTTKSNKRSLIFALFSAEEKGLLGSKHLAKKLKEEGFNLYTMLNFEMTGVPLKDKDYTVYITGFEKSNLAEISNKYAKEKLVGFLPTAKEFNLFQRSDNYPFYTEFGVPSHTFCTFDFTNFIFYHKVGDEIKLMDFEHMASLINKMLPVVENITNAEKQEVQGI